jgi:hypothetical protein
MPEKSSFQIKGCEVVLLQMNLNPAAIRSNSV